MGELISVIVPVFNAELYLENCLSSILQQTYSNIEIIVIDDGSTDSTLAIAIKKQRLYPDKVHVFHTQNQGVTLARFEGIKKSHGTWIGFVDGDDEIEPDMYERLYSNAIEYQADISHCGHQTIVNDGERIHYFYNTGNVKVQNKESALKDLLIGPVEPNIWSKLYHRVLLEKLLQSGKMDTSIKYNEDLLMNYYLFSGSATSIYEDFCGYHYLARSSSATRSAFRIEKITDPVKVWKKIMEGTNAAFTDELLEKYLSACINAFACLSAISGHEKEASKYRGYIMEYRKRWGILKLATRIKIFFLLLSPHFYNRFMAFYRRFFQKKVYE